MTLLTIVGDAAVELGLTRPTSITTSSDPAVQVLYALANKEGKELARRFDWQRLQSEGTFTTLAAETQVAAIDTTFPLFGHIVNQTMWNRTQAQPVRGPLTATEWQMKKAAAAQAAYGNWFRIRGNAILFFPNPAAGDSVYFEYISRYWCQSAALAAQTAFTADTDTALLDETIIGLGLVWRFRKAKGFDYGEDFRTYEMALQDIFGPDSGRPGVDMTGDEPILGINIPEGNWAIP